VTKYVVSVNNDAFDDAEENPATIEQIRDDMTELLASGFFNVTNVEEENFIAEGIWCNECEFFEEIITTAGALTCPNCGCALDNHMKVKVIAL
jgi:hypothetical protein